MMPAHVNHFGSFPDRQVSGFNYGIGRAYKGHDCPVGRLARIYIQQFYTFNFFDLIGNGLDYRHVTSLRKIGNTFNELFHKIL